VTFPARSGRGNVLAVHGLRHRPGESQVQKSRPTVALAAVLLLGPAGCQAGGTAPVGPSPSAPVPSAVATSPSVPASAAPPSAGPATSSPPGPAAPTRSATAAATPPPAAGAFPLAVTRSGGFAGVDDHASVTADGTAVVTSRDRPAARTSLPAATVDELRRLVTSPEFAGWTPPPGAPVCNDGFEYEWVTPSSVTRVQDCGGGHGATVDRVLAITADLLDG
jgi:hypothetical protein